MSKCAQSKSTKTDKELVWEKLSTPPVTFVFHDVGRRGGFEEGELVVYASGNWEGGPIVHDSNAST